MTLFLYLHRERMLMRQIRDYIHDILRKQRNLVKMMIADGESDSLNVNLKILKYQ
jgi:hypothetical protein